MFDKDWDDIPDDVNYFDSFSEEQQQIKAVDQFITHITLDDRTEVMKSLLKNSLCYDSKAYPGIFVSTWIGQVRYDKEFISGANPVIEKPTKMFYRRQAKNGNLIVVRHSFDESIDAIVKDIAIAIMDDHDFFYNIVLRSELLERLCTLVNKEKVVDLDCYYEKETTLKTQFLKLIEPLTNGVLKRRLRRML